MQFITKNIIIVLGCILFSNSCFAIYGKTDVDYIKEYSDIDINQYININGLYKDKYLGSGSYYIPLSPEEEFQMVIEDAYRNGSSIRLTEPEIQKAVDWFDKTK